jgi:hypothetical protein
VTKIAQILPVSGDESSNLTELIMMLDPLVMTVVLIEEFKKLCFDFL